MAGNRDAFIDIWGPRIFRDALLDAIDGGDRFSSDPFHVGIVIAGDDPSSGSPDRTVEELGGALEANGWRVSTSSAPATAGTAPDPSVEAVIVLDQTCDIRLSCRGT